MVEEGVQCYPNQHCGPPHQQGRTNLVHWVRRQEKNHQGPEHGAQGFDKTAAFDDKPRQEIEETLGALDDSHGTKANSRQAARLHTVRRSIVLVDFAIKSKRGKAMAFTSS